jgi:hypothetical protein
VDDHPEEVAEIFVLQGLVTDHQGPLHDHLLLDERCHLGDLVKKLKFLDIKINEDAQIRHLWRKLTALSCHRYLKTQTLYA